MITKTDGSKTAEVGESRRFFYPGCHVEVIGPENVIRGEFTVQSVSASGELVADGVLPVGTGPGDTLRYKSPDEWQGLDRN